MCIEVYVLSNDACFEESVQLKLSEGIMRRVWLRLLEGTKAHEASGPISPPRGFLTNKVLV